MFRNIFEPGIFIGKVVTIIASYVTCVAFSIVTLLLTKRKIKKYIKGIFTLPFFILTWIPINIVCLFVKEIKWEQIKHQRKVEVESIVKFD